MKRARVEDNTGVSQGKPVPSCQWSFNRAHEFHHVGGDTVSLFGRRATDLWHRHVSLIDDTSGSWSARLDRMFQGQDALEQSSAGPKGEYALFHILVRGDDGMVTHVAGFAFPAGSPIPAAAELQLAASAVLQALKPERTRVTRFLHDIVAQSLSGTGFQLEALILEIQAQSAEAPARATEIQRSLDDVLRLIRKFNAPQ